MADIPKWRDMTVKITKRPFTVGVNVSDPKGRAEARVKEHKMTWPIIFDGEDWPIERKWNVLSLPTVYVIDATGIIRHKQDLEDEEAFDAAIEKLIREAKRKQ